MGRARRRRTSFSRINDHTNAVTEMRNGMFRAECFRPDCGWWIDSTSEDDAKEDMRQHNRSHRPEAAQISD